MKLTVLAFKMDSLNYEIGLFNDKIDRFHTRDYHIK